MHGRKLCTFLKLLPVLQALWFPANAESFLSNTLIRKDQVQSVLEHRPIDVSECENPKVRFCGCSDISMCSQVVFKPTGPIDTTMCDYETVESVNGDLFSNIHELVKTPFFKYFQVRQSQEHQLAHAHNARLLGRSIPRLSILGRPWIV